jgi:hypothetical protein
MPLTIDPQVVVDGAKLAVAALVDVVPLPPGVGAALESILPTLLGWITTEIEGGRDPKPAILQLALSTADTAADAAQALKFGA